MISLTNLVIPPGLGLSSSTSSSSGSTTGISADLFIGGDGSTVGCTLFSEILVFGGTLSFSLDNRRSVKLRNPGFRPLLFFPQRHQCRHLMRNV